MLVIAVAFTVENPPVFIHCFYPPANFFQTMSDMMGQSRIARFTYDEKVRAREKK
jgi:hypothetical protein